MTKEATPPMGCWNVLVAAGSAAEEVAAESVGRVMCLEAAHTLDPPFDSTMVLFGSII